MPTAPGASHRRWRLTPPFRGLDRAFVVEVASNSTADRGLRAGDDVIAIFDAQSGRLEREVSISTVDEVFNPTWSPDGRAIVFTGLSQG